MPWRKLSVAQGVILVPIIIKFLAWSMLLIASVIKLLGYPEIATVLMAIASALGVADAKTEINNLKDNE